MNGAAGRDAAWPQVALGGVTELRVHGVGGTPPSDMLDVPAPVQVGGDRTAGVWRAGGPPAPVRHVEAYAWGGLTARAASRALWLLVLPFALVNLAGWMAPGRHAGAFRGAVRVMGVAVTGLYVAFAAAAAMDFAAYQCGGAVDRGRACAVGSWWLVGEGGAAHDPGRRVAVGACVPIALLGVLWRLTRQSRRAYEQWNDPGAATLPSSDGPAEKGLTFQGFWRGQGYAARLAEVHVTVGLAVVAAPLGRTAQELGGSRPGGLVWQLSVLTVVAGAVLAGVTRWRSRLPAGAVAAWGGALVVVALAVAWAGTGPASAADPLVMPGLPLLFGLFIPTLVPGVVAVFATSYWHRGTAGPHRLRYAVTAAALVQIAVMTTLALLSGFVLWIAQRLGDARAFRQGAEPPVIEYAQAFEVLARAIPWAPLLFASTAAVAWVVVARRGVGPARDRAAEAWSGIERPPGWSDGREDRAWRAAWRRALLLPSASLAALEWGAWVTSAAAVPPTIAYWVLWTQEMNRRQWAATHIEVDVGWLTPLPLSACTWLLTALPIAAVFVLRRSLTDPRTRRIVAIGWDVATFWPRSFHPLAPPSYAERAVPELQARLRRIWRGDGPDRPGAVLLLGHSQGAVLVTAALAALPTDSVEPGRLSVVTYGSPVRRLYARHFPAYFTDALVEDTVARLRPAPDAPAAWRNAHRDTDYVGGRLFAPGHRLEAVDVYLADPPSPFHPPGDPPPAARNHLERGYRRQGALVDVVSEEATRLRGGLVDGRSAKP